MELHPNLAQNFHPLNQRCSANPVSSTNGLAPYTSQPTIDPRLPQQMSNANVYPSVSHLEISPSHRGSVHQLSSQNTASQPQHFGTLPRNYVVPLTPEYPSHQLSTTRSSTSLQITLPPSRNYSNLAPSTYSRSIPYSNSYSTINTLHQHPAHHVLHSRPQVGFTPTEPSRYNYPATTAHELSNNCKPKSTPLSYAHRLQQKVKLSSKSTSPDSADVKSKGSKTKDSKPENSAVKDFDFKLKLNFEDPDATFSFKPKHETQPKPMFKPKLHHRALEKRNQNQDQKQKPNQRQEGSFESGKKSPDLTSISFADEIFMELEKPKPQTQTQPQTQPQLRLQPSQARTSNIYHTHSSNSRNMSVPPIFNNRSQVYYQSQLSTFSPQMTQHSTYPSLNASPYQNRPAATNLQKQYIPDSNFAQPKYRQSQTQLYPHPHPQIHLQAQINPNQQYHQQFHPQTQIPPNFNMNRSRFNSSESSDTVYSTEDQYYDSKSSVFTVANDNGLQPKFEQMTIRSQKKVHF